MNARGLRQYAPKARITIRRASNGYTTEDISNDIRSVSTTKAYGNPMGSFSVVTTFKRNANGQRYDQLLKRNDIILIEFDKGAGKGFVPVMLGLINAPRRSMAWDALGRPQYTCQITGADFGKILVKAHCCWYIAPNKDHIGSEDAMTKAQYGAALIAGGTPSTILKKIIETELFRYLPWTKEHINIDRINAEDNWTLPNVTFSMQNTIWQALQTYADEPYCKLHADTGDTGKFHIIHEKCPFENSGLGKLTRQTFKEIEPLDVIQSALGANDDDEINYMFHSVRAGQFAESAGTPLLFIKGDAVHYDEPSVLKNGFLPWYPQTKFVPFISPAGNAPELADKGKDTNVKRLVKERTDAFWTWYSRNHELESGTIRMHGDPDFRSGDAALYLDNQYEYLVEQVIHTYSTHPKVTYTTQMHLTRGQKHANG